MDRKEFVKLCTGIIGGLGIHQILGDSANAEPEDNHALSDSYLERGLIGMANTKGHWFGAHWGASVLAGYYLCKENNLNEETVAAIKGQLDNIIELRKGQFVSLPKEPSNESLINDVPRSLSPSIRDGLRADGHAVIFASISTKAMRDVPHMAQPSIVNSLDKLSRAIGKGRAKKPTGVATYVDTQAMIDATFDSVARFRGVLGRPSVKRPNFTHMMTHTDALMTLDMMGYEDVARDGHSGHRAHIAAAVPDVDHKVHPLVNHLTLEDVMCETFWTNQEHLTQWNKKTDLSTNRNGDWIAAGHLFKVLYSYHRLTKRIKDERKIRLCSAILLERYINPDVQGG